MTKAKSTKRALLSSVVALLLCCAMLMGTTFAWFTDSVSTGVNKITAGNLDVELQYSTDMASWDTVKDTTNVFKDGALWEPGHTEVVYLKVTNVGSLALKYKLGIRVASKVDGVNEAGETIDLSQYIKFGIVDGVDAAYADRAAARAAVETDAMPIAGGYGAKELHLLPGESSGIIALVVYMPEDVGNAANYVGETAPEINLGISVYATQDTVESDSFDKYYDKHLVIPVLDAATAAKIASITPGASDTVTIDGIEFYVLAKQDGQALLLTKDSQGHARFDAEGSCEWETSDARAYLNSTWLNEHPTLKAAALATELKTVVPSWNESYPSFVTTQDQVFLLTEADVFGTEQEQTVTDTEYYTAGSTLTIPELATTDYPWWLRTPANWGYTVDFVDCGYPTDGTYDNVSKIYTGGTYNGGTYNFQVPGFWNYSEWVESKTREVIWYIDLRPALWVDYEVHVGTPTVVSEAGSLTSALTETGYVEISTGTVTVAQTAPMQTADVEITSSSESGTVVEVTKDAGSKNGVVTFAPQSSDDAFFAENDEFTVTLSDDVTIQAGKNGASGIVLGNSNMYDSDGNLLDYYQTDTNAVSYRETGKTLNINGGTFISYSGSGNGAICVTNMSNCTVNVSNATLIVGKSGRNYAAFIALDTREARTQQGYYFTDISVKDTSVTFTNCTFKLDDGTVIDPTDTTNEQFVNWFYGFGGTSGNTLIIDGQTIIG